MRAKPKTRKTKQPAKGSLAGFADARKVKNPLLKEVQAHVVAQGNKNAGAGREKHKIHVSELIKDEACPRHLFYKITETEPTDPPKAAYHRLEMIWAAGHHEHAKWQRWLEEMGDLWGTWYCKRCQHEFDGTSPTECPACGYAGFLEYREVNLEDGEYLIVGHADGAVPRLDCLVEVKSFSVGTMRIESPDLVKRHTHKVDGKSLVDQEGLWSDIRRPLKSHLRQGMFYLWMCERMGLPYKKIVFIYENKTTQATKAFEVEYSARIVEPFIKTMDAVLQAVEAGDPPARPKLFVPESNPCNGCVFRSECWGNNEETHDRSTTDAAVPARRSRARSQAKAGAAADLPAQAARATVSGDSGRPNRFGRRRTDVADDRTDPVGGTPRDSVGSRRGGRAVGSGRDGEGEGARPHRVRQGRDRAEGEGLPERRVRRG